MKNKLYIMVGCPGSGKSIYAKKYLSDAVYISRDDIRFSLVKENEEYFSKEKEVFKVFINKINNELQNGHDVVADATHLNPSSRFKLLVNLDLNKDKTEVVAIFIRVPLSICLKQNENRKGTRSYVPKSVIKRMHYSLVPPNTEECYGLIDVIHTITPGR